MRRMPCNDDLEDCRVQASVATLGRLRAMPSAAAEPLYGAFRNGVEGDRRSGACPGRAVLPLPSDRRLERHQGSRLVQAPLDENRRTALRRSTDNTRDLRTECPL